MNILETARATGVRFSEPCQACETGLLVTRDGHQAVCQGCGATEPTSGLTLTGSREKARVSVVYYVLFGDRVKIGTTMNLRSRLRSIPHDEVLATEPGGYELEKRRHAQLHSSRIYANREWFYYNDEVRAHIASLSA